MVNFHMYAPHMYKHAYPSSADEAWHLPKRASYVHVHVHVTFGLCNDSTHNLVIRVHVHIHVCVIYFHPFTTIQEPVFQAFLL